MTEVLIGGIEGKDSAIMSFSLVVCELVSNDELHQVPSKMEQLCLERWEVKVIQSGGGSSNLMGSSNLAPLVWSWVRDQPCAVWRPVPGTRYKSSCRSLPVRWMSLKIYVVPKYPQIKFSAIAIFWMDTPHFQTQKKQDLRGKW